MGGRTNDNSTDLIGPSAITVSGEPALALQPTDLQVTQQVANSWWTVNGTRSTATRSGAVQLELCTCIVYTRGPES